MRGSLTVSVLPRNGPPARASAELRGAVDACLRGLEDGRLRVAEPGADGGSTAEDGQAPAGEAAPVAPAMQPAQAAEVLAQFASSTDFMLGNLGEHQFQALEPMDLDGTLNASASGTTA